MEQSLTKNASMIQEFLKRKGLDCAVIELPGDARTAAQAAAFLECEVSHIVKSLIFKTTTTDNPILILASGTNRVDENVIESLLGESITKADANYTRAVTGYAIGGIPPLGHQTTIKPILIDQDLLKLDAVWAAAGTPSAVFKIRVGELLSVTQATPVRIK